MAPSSLSLRLRLSSVLLFVASHFIAGSHASDDRVVVYIGDRIQRQELTLFDPEEKFSFQLDPKSHLCNLNGSQALGSGTCIPKLSLSLLKMDCFNSTEKPSYLLIEDQDPLTPSQETICLDYEYLYTNVRDPSHKNMDQFRSTTSTINITTKGNWGYNATKVSLLVSVHYEFVSPKCPERFYDCTTNCRAAPDVLRPPADTRVCIPQDWRCDKRPNCGICEDADECENLCDWTAGTTAIPYANFLILILDVVCFGIIPFVVILIVLKYALKAAQLNQTHRSRRPVDSEDNCVPYIPRRKSEDPPPSYGEVVVDVPPVAEEATEINTSATVRTSTNPDTDSNNNTTRSPPA